MHRSLDWESFYAAAGLKKNRDYGKRLTHFGEMAAKRFEAEAFEEFCETNLAALDDVAKEFFGSEQAKDAVRQKVHALFPDHEWNEFTDHFYGEIQKWREASS